jgi:putative transposase
VVKTLALLAAVCRRRRLPVGKSWRMDKTYVKVGVQWKYLYRAVDKSGDTIDFLLRAKRDHAAARALFERAIDLHGVPDKVTIDKSDSNTDAIVGVQADIVLPIEMRQSKYLSSTVEQDHRAIKGIARTMLEFKTLLCARILIAGIKVMHMVRKGQLADAKDQAPLQANEFYSLAF